MESKFNTGLTSLNAGCSTFEEKNMNKLFFLCVSVGLLYACSVTRSYDMTGFTIAGNVVSYQGTPMAQLEGVELALDNNKMVREMTFSLMDNADMSKVANMIAFLHEKHPDYEIEVEIDVEKMPIAPSLKK